MKKADIAMQVWKKETRMKNLINAAMDRFDPEELLELMYEKCCNADQRRDLREKMIDITTFEGGIFIKIDSMDKEQRIKDFVKTEIYPYANEQRYNLFSYL